VLAVDLSLVEESRDDTARDAVAGTDQLEPDPTIIAEPGILVVSAWHRAHFMWAPRQQCRRPEGLRVPWLREKPA